MDKLIINGGRKLQGDVTISGAKNAALPAMSAALLAPGAYTINRVPELKDVLTMGRLLAHMGAKVSHNSDGVSIDTSALGSSGKFEAPYDLVKTMRASVLVLCPLVARYGQAKVSLPGGCAIGARPINLHLMGLEKMGAEIRLEEGYVYAKARRLKGARIYFDMPTVTGTENLMMAAALAKGTTVLENAAREPEITDLANMLTAMGAQIEGAGQSEITIEGVDELKPCTHNVIADRIEAGTFMAVAIATGGKVRLRDVEPEHLQGIIEKLTETGAAISETADTVTVTAPQKLHSADLKTTPYPGFPTDMQAQFMALMGMASGASIIKERIFENRFMHVAELRRMGADITVEGNLATVKGVAQLKGAEVMATDLRASASLVIAALAARGKTTIDRIYHLDRGYFHIEDKLRKLGADIKRAN